MRPLSLVLCLAVSCSLAAPVAAQPRNPDGRAKAKAPGDRAMTEQEKEAHAEWFGLGLAVLIVCGLLAFVFYFLPSAVAFFRGHPNFAPILVVNIFLGWLLIGWVVALAWSVSAFEKPRCRRSASSYDDNPFS